MRRCFAAEASPARRPLISTDTATGVLRSGPPFGCRLHPMLKDRPASQKAKSHGGARAGSTFGLRSGLDHDWLFVRPVRGPAAHLSARGRTLPLRLLAFINSLTLNDFMFEIDAASSWLLPPAWRND